MTKMAAMPIYGKAHFQGTTCTELILMKLCSKHQIPSKCFIFCSNYDHGLTLTYFIARSNLQFIWENVTMMDSLIQAQVSGERCFL